MIPLGLRFSLPLLTSPRHSPQAPETPAVEVAVDSLIDLHAGGAVFAASSSLQELQLLSFH